LDALRYSLTLENKSNVGTIKLDRLLGKVNMSRRMAVIDVLITFCEDM
jgi:hypothetical protein